VYGTLHYGGSWPNNVHSGETFESIEADFSQEFHVFSIQWEPGEIRWYVDGEHYQTQTRWYSEYGEFPAPFDRQFHLILNVAVGGNWPGPPDETTSFPQQMQIDYVRVYQKVDGE
jgi:beta-glucanase (GH16 family)